MRIDKINLPNKFSNVFTELDWINRNKYLLTNSCYPEIIKDSNGFWGFKKTEK